MLELNFDHLSILSIRRGVVIIVPSPLVFVREGNQSLKCCVARSLKFNVWFESARVVVDIQ